MGKKTVEAHNWINSREPDKGCDHGMQYVKGIRADVRITEPIQVIHLGNVTQKYFFLFYAWIFYDD